MTASSSTSRGVDPTGGDDRCAAVTDTHLDHVARVVGKDDPPAGTDTNRGEPHQAKTCTAQQDEAQSSRAELSGVQLMPRSGLRASADSRATSARVGARARRRQQVRIHGVEVPKSHSRLRALAATWGTSNRRSYVRTYAVSTADRPNTAEQHCHMGRGATLVQRPETRLVVADAHRQARSPNGQSAVWCIGVVCRPTLHPDGLDRTGGSGRTGPGTAEAGTAVGRNSTAVSVHVHDCGRDSTAGGHRQGDYPPSSSTAPAPTSTPSPPSRKNFSASVVEQPQ